MIKYRKNCRVCGSPLRAFLDLGNQHIQGAFVQKGKGKASVRKIPLHICVCDKETDENACGLVQSNVDIDSSILYSSYYYRSNTSKTMRDWLKYVAEKTIELFKGDKEVRLLEIACNDGSCFANYPENWLKTGIDPSDITGKIDIPGINIINETFPSSRLYGEKFDCISSLACFYDTPGPVNFAQTIKENLSYGGVWVFEVADLSQVITNLEYSGLVFEHCVTYSLATIEYILEEAGLKLFDVEQTATNGGSLLCFATHKDCDLFDTPEQKTHLNDLKVEEFDRELDKFEVYERFAEQVQEHKDELLFTLKFIKQLGKTIHVLGSSTKLNTVLEYCGIDTDIVDCASERDPNKWGAKTLSGIPIISEEESRKLKPDFYLVGPTHFRRELLEREQEIIKNGTQFIFPFPNIEIVNQDNIQKYLIKKYAL